MKIEEIIGKSITNIYSTINYEIGGNDTAKCFVELDGQMIISLSFDQSRDILFAKPDKDSVSLFSDLNDIPIYYVNKEGKTIGEINNQFQKKRNNMFNRVRKALFGHEPVLKDYLPYKIEFQENKLKYIKDRKIIDIIWYHDDWVKSCLLLENGYLITETTLAIHGTGMAGLNYYENMEIFAKEIGVEYVKYSDKKKGSR